MTIMATALSLALLTTSVVAQSLRASTGTCHLPSVTSPARDGQLLSLKPI